MNITCEELDKNLSGFKILDMRSAAECDYGMIEGAERIVSREIIDNPSEDKDTPIVIYCARGQFSVEIAEALCGLGYNAYNLVGGYAAWLRYIMNKEQEADFNEKVEQSLKKKFAKTIWSKFTKALNVYKLIEEGDRVAVCISGGKDSMLMAKLFDLIHRYSKFPFEVKYLVMDPGYNTQNREIIEQNARHLNIPIEIFETNIFESVYNVKNNPCYLCARMRRGHLYNKAKQMGCNKIALGHHYDDVIETILMGMLYGSQIETMMPKLHSDNFEGMELIRPLYLVREDDIKAWRDYNGLHFIQCACKFTDTCTTCENNETKSKRLETKLLIRELKKTNPYVENHIFRSVENVNLKKIIAYKQNGVTHHFLDTYDDSSDSTK